MLHLDLELVSQLKIVALTSWTQVSRVNTDVRPTDWGLWSEKSENSPQMQACHMCHILYLDCLATFSIELTAFFALDFVLQ